MILALFAPAFSVSLRLCVRRLKYYKDKDLSHAETQSRGEVKTGNAFLKGREPGPI